MIANSDQVLCVQVASVLKARWPEGSVHLFGSTANCLSITNNNDIDVCLELPELPDEQARCPGPSASSHSRPQLHTTSQQPCNHSQDLLTSEQHCL